VKSDRVLVSSPHDSWLTEGFVCSDMGKVSIFAKDRPSDLEPFRDCLQSGPLLLVGGKPPSDLPSRRTGGYDTLARSTHEQAFVCVDGAGQVVLGVTGKVNLPGLVEWVRGPELGCVDAIRLTGKDTAGLRFGTELYGSDDYLFPSALGIVARPP